LNGPLHNLSDDYLFSAHMAQHLVLTLLFPPLLLYGAPAEVVRRLVRPVWVRRLAAVATRPLVAATLFTAPIALWHLPVLYEAAVRHHPLHIVQHLVFLATAVLMWWPVLSPVPELPRLSYPGQMLYLFLLESRCRWWARSSPSPTRCSTPSMPLPPRLRAAAACRPADRRADDVGARGARLLAGDDRGVVPLVGERAGRGG